MSGVNEISVLAGVCAVCVMAQADPQLPTDPTAMLQWGFAGFVALMLAWRLIKREPAQEDKFCATITHIADTHQATFKEVCSNFHSCVDKIELGQSSIVDAIERGNDKHSQILHETLLQRRMLEKHEEKP
jgi:hypothetical protein